MSGQWDLGLQKQLLSVQSYSQRTGTSQPHKICIQVGRTCKNQVAGSIQMNSVQYNGFDFPVERTRLNSDGILRDV